MGRLSRGALEWLGAALVCLATAGLAIGFTLLGGCQTFGLPPAVAPLVSAVPPCADPQPEPESGDVCDGEVTPEQLQCVLCDVPRGCLLAGAAVYCAPACADPYCTSPRERGR